MTRDPTPPQTEPAGEASPSWAGDGSEAHAPPAVAASTQLPLFVADEPARGLGLRRIKAMLARRRRAAPPARDEAEGASQPGSSWPDSFFADR